MLPAVPHCSQTETTVTRTDKKSLSLELPIYCGGKEGRQIVNNIYE